MRIIDYQNTLTILKPTNIHAKYYSWAKKSPQSLGQEVHGKFPPGLSPQQTEGKGHSRVYVTSCKIQSFNMSILRYIWNEIFTEHNVNDTMLYRLSFYTFMAGLVHAY